MTYGRSLLALALLTVTGASALAAAPLHVTADDRGYVDHGVTYSWVGGRWQRVDSWNLGKGIETDQIVPRAGDLSADGAFVYTGRSETGWDVRPHAYRWENWRFVHADTLSHDGRRPSLAVSAQERRSMQELHGR